MTEKKFTSRNFKIKAPNAIFIIALIKENLKCVIETFILMFMSYVPMYLVF
jgi:hypothetical protein